MQIVENTTVREAHIYRHGAIIVRDGNVTLEQGANKVYLTGMPRDITRESIRVKFPSVVSQGSVQVVDMRDSDLLGTDDEKRKELQEELNRVNKRIANKNTERDLWTRNADFSASDNIPTSDRMAFIAQLPERLDAVDAEIAQLNKEVERLNKEIADLDRKGLGLGNSHFAPYAIVLEVEAREAGECNFEVQYQTDSASWRPLYEIRVDHVGDPVSLLLRAEVFQSTGSDWSGVKLKLSSGDMNSSFEMPELRRLYVDFPKKRERHLKRSAGFGMPQPMMAMSAAMSAPAPSKAENGAAYEPDFDEPLYEMPTAGATKLEGQTMSTYELAGTWDIESGAQGRVVDLARNELPADYRLVCIPSEDDGAYLTANVQGLSDIDLFECEASIYLEGTFVGATEISPDAIARDQTVPLGRDERVHVERKRTRYYTSTPPLLGKTKIEVAYEIDVFNRRPDAAQIEVRDRIPVSRNKDIDVAATQLTGGSLDAETGEVTWTFTAQPNTRSAIAMEYVITHPKNKPIEERASARQARSMPAPPPRFDSRGMPFCLHCGHKLDPSSVFCPVCGSSTR